MEVWGSVKYRTWGEWAIALHGMVLVPEILLIENLKSILSIWSPHSLHSDSNWRLYDESN